MFYAIYVWEYLIKNRKIDKRERKVVVFVRKEQLHRQT